MSAGKAAHGDGSYYRNGRGQWVGAVSLGKDANGRRKRVTRVFRNERDARIWVREQRSRVVLGEQVTRTTVTVSALAADYLEHGLRPNLRETTVEWYRYMFGSYVLSVLGVRVAQEVTTREINDWLDGLASRDLSESTQRSARHLLRAAYRHGMGVWDLPRNPVLASRPIASSLELKPLPHDPLSEGEAKLLIASAPGGGTNAVVKLALLTGMRCGEILALQWADIDREAGTLRVTGTLREMQILGPNGRFVTVLVRNRPKTRASRRTLRITGPIAALLDAQQHRQKNERVIAGDLWKSGDPVFTSGINTPLHSSNVRKRFHRLLDTTGLRRIRLHDLRHSAAVLLLRKGIPLEVVSQTLGHSSPAFTKARYAPYVQELANRGVEALADILSDPNPNPDVF